MFHGLERQSKWGSIQRPRAVDSTLAAKPLPPDKSDFLAEGKKVLPAEVMATSYKKFLARNNPPPFFADNKSGKGKGKGKFGTARGHQRSKGPPPETELTCYDLLMLPHPDVVNHDEGTYVIHGPLTYKTRVTRENWATLRFNTKTGGPEYFPSSYLSPVLASVEENVEKSR